MKSHSILLPLLLAFAATAATAQTTAITGATVHTVASAGTLENATVLIQNGRIAAVGTAIAVPAGATVIDASGKIVTPGLFSAIGQIGLSEVNAVAETNDATQRGDDLSAGFDVVDAYNRRSIIIPITRIDGVTRALIAPHAGGPDEMGNSSKIFSGLASVVQLGDQGDFLTRRGVAIVANLGDTGGYVAAGSRASAVQQLRAAFADALDYRQNKSAYQRGDWRDYSLSAADLEALLPVLDGDRSMIFNANRASDIEVIISLTREFGIHAIIEGAAEAWMLAAELAAANISVIIDGTANLPGDFDAVNARLESGGILAAAGVRVAFGAGAQTHQARNITQSAGNAVANGMDWDDALAAITLAPAAMYGVDDELGSIEVGKSADLVIWDADPLELSSYPVEVLISGVSIPLQSRQTLLRDRYLSTDTDKPPAFRH